MYPLFALLSWLPVCTIIRQTSARTLWRQTSKATKITGYSATYHARYKNCNLQSGINFHRHAAKEIINPGMLCHPHGLIPPRSGQATCTHVSIGEGWRQCAEVLGYSWGFAWTDGVGEEYKGKRPCSALAPREGRAVMCFAAGQGSWCVRVALPEAGVLVLGRGFLGCAGVAGVTPDCLTFRGSAAVMGL